MPSSRVTITIPGSLVDEADRKAADLDRSRSWLLVEALRRYLDEPEGGSAGASASAGAKAVREWASPYVVPGLGSQRMAQLRADLSLDAEERVRAAEETARGASASARKPALDRVIAFRSIEDFHRWERREVLGRAADW